MMSGLRTKGGEVVWALRLGAYGALAVLTVASLLARMGKDPAMRSETFLVMAWGALLVATATSEGLILAIRNCWVWLIGAPAQPTFPWIPTVTLELTTLVMLATRTPLSIRRNIIGCWY